MSLPQLKIWKGIPLSTRATIFQVVDKSMHHQAKTTLYLTDLSVEYLTHHEDNLKHLPDVGNKEPFT